jgi:hypothetical protein
LTLLAWKPGNLKLQMAMHAGDDTNQQQQSNDKIKWQP